MSNLDFEIKNKIISYLRQSDYGASASEIAKKVNHNRITIGKYLSILQAEKVVTSKRVASAIYWQLAQFSTKPQILIVDDEKHILDLIRLSLSNGRYDIFESLNGKEALSMVRTISPDLIILDLMMPKVNGFDVCRELKANVFTKDIPIIVLSAKGEVEDKISLLDQGVDDYITKPFDPLELEARVANKLRKKESQHSKNSVTGLSSEIITAETKARWQEQGFFVETILKIEHFKEFSEIFGHKKSCDVLKLFTRMLLSCIPKDDGIYLGHLSESSFVLFSKKSLQMQEELVEKFFQLRPFLYVNQGDISKDLQTISLTIDDKKVNHNLLNLVVLEEKHD